MPHATPVAPRPRPRRSLRVLAVGLGLVVLAALLPAQRAPYAALRYTEAGVEVQHAGRWHRLQAIDGQAVAALLDHSKAAYGALWRKRFAEDLVRVMRGHGTPPGDTVRLDLVDPTTGEPVVVAAAPMTRDNRQAVLRTWEDLSERPAAARPAGRAVNLANGFPTLSPFTAMKRVDGAIHVQVAGRPGWFRWQSLDGVAADDIWQWTVANANRPWKRITEDLVAVLATMRQAEVDTKVTLGLVDLASGKAVELADVPMTGENRRRVWHANQAEPGDVQPASLDVPAWRAELAAFRAVLDERFAYRALHGVDLDTELAALVGRLGDEPVTVDTLAIELNRIIARFGDGHAGVRGWTDALDGNHLPVLVGAAGGGLVAFHADRSALLDTEHPFLVAIDGRPLADWFAGVRPWIVDGSPQYVRWQSLSLLRRLDALRSLLDVPRDARVELTLAASPEPGAARLVRTLRTTQTRPLFGTWPRRETGWIEDGIGYLRLPSMDDDPRFLAAIDAAMAGFRGARGLVIDVRGNGGGSREALRRVLPYLLTDDVPARVCNVAKPHLGAVGATDDQPRDTGLLANRFLYPVGWPGWRDAQRAALIDAARRFEPEWQPPAAAFGDWHYMVVDRETNPAAFPIGCQVVVLQDDFCFSATDIFLAALQGVPGVTLVGTASGGGSARSRTWTLPNSGLHVRLASMASFRPDGRLYDGRGIEPDVVVERAPGDLVEQGDAQLEAALARLR